MKQSLMKRWVRWTLALICLCVFAITGASCRSLVGVGDYEGAIDAYCSLLDRCYADDGAGDCQTRALAKVTASGDEWTAWLSYLTDKQCTLTCRSARGCLDNRMLCEDAACEKKEDCCGFLFGRSDCDSESKTCCRPEGTNCDPENDNCCPGMGPCSPHTKTCGGVYCRSAAVPCASSFECCSNVCVDGFCAEQICAVDGFDCARDEDCCSKQCIGMTCATPECGNAGLFCSAERPCCSSLVCHVTDQESGIGVCSTCDGFPNEYDCSSNAQCCSNFCDPSSFRCRELCTGKGQACVPGMNCCEGSCTDEGVCPDCTNSTCSAGSECCSGLCIAGQCKPQCKKGTCAHDACSIGEPLSKACEDCASPMGCKLDAMCVEAVCAEDDFCCCTDWDSLCVIKASKLEACNESCTQVSW